MGISESNMQGGGFGGNIMDAFKNALPKELKKIAHKLGKRLVTDDEFLDLLADALDGHDVGADLSDSDEDTESRSESTSVHPSQSVMSSLEVNSSKPAAARGGKKT